MYGSAGLAWHWLQSVESGMVAELGDGPAAMGDAGSVAGGRSRSRRACGAGPGSRQALQSRAVSSAGCGWATGRDASETPGGKVRSRRRREDGVVHRGRAGAKP